MSNTGAQLKLSQVRAISPNSRANELYSVQVMFSNYVQITNKNTGKINRIVKATLLCRANPGGEPSEFDEIELAQFVFTQQAAEAALQFFCPGKLLILKNMGPSVKPSTSYRVVPHPYTINYSVSSWRDADRSKELVILETMSIMEKDTIAATLTLEEYAESRKFQVCPIADLNKYEGGIVSVLGIVSYISGIQEPSQADGNPRRHVTLYDISDCTVTVTAFGVDICNKLDCVSKGSIVCLRGCRCTTFKGLSLTMSDSSHVIPNVGSNPWMSDYTGLHLQQCEGAYSVTENMPTENDEYIPRDLGTLMDSVTELSEIQPRMRSLMRCKIVGFDTELGEIWNYRCEFKNPSDGRSCFAQTNLSSDGTWVCTTRREDGSYPAFEGETLEVIKERKHLGHVMKGALMRTYITVRLIDDSLRPGQSMLAKLSHEALEKLFEMDTYALAKLQTPAFCKKFRDIIFSQEKSYPVGSPEYQDRQRREAQFYEHDYSMGWDEVSDREYGQEYLIKATSKYVKPIQASGFSGPIDTNGLTIDSLQLIPVRNSQHQQQEDL